MTGDARKIALTVLNTLNRQRKTLDAVLEEVIDRDAAFSRRDRALVNALVYGVLRWRGRLDRIIGHFSKTPLEDIEPAVLNILRVGLFQIMYLNRIPDSAAVNTSVELAKSFSAPWVVKYVNAVLRNCARGYNNVSFPDMSEDPVSALAAEKSFPQWLTRRWLERFGLDETVELCDAINAIPPITVRANSLKITRDQLVKALKTEAESVEPTDTSPVGISFFNPTRPIFEMKSFQTGWFQVQDEAAQLATFLLNPKPGGIVLDACAGLGGKTGHVAQMMNNHGRVVAMDKDARKLLRLETEMKRLGISIVSSCVHDLENPPPRLEFELFDAVLLDAPCSGLGVLRRNPDTKWSLRDNDLGRHTVRQAKFLENLAHLVKPSGVLLYTVCSTEPEENMEVVEIFLDKHSDFIVDNNPGGLPEKARPLAGADACFRTFPHRNNMDGFFSIRLKRIT